MSRWLFAFVVLLGLLVVAVDDAQASGWVWRSAENGLFIRANGTTNDGWYYRRHWCDGRWIYRQYYRVSPASSYGGYGQERWREKLLDIAANRDRYEAQGRASALEHSEFIDSVRVLGLEGNFHLQGYGYAPTYSQGAVAGYGAGAGYAGPYAQQGNTVYGYQQYAASYGQGVDLSALYNQAGRLTSQAQEFAGQATSDFSGLVDQQAQGQAEVAKILAQGQAAATALSQTKPAPVAPTFRTFSFRTEVGADGKMQVMGGPNDLTLKAEQLISLKCATCHNAEKPSKGLDLTAIASWTKDQRDQWGPVILAAVTNPDPAKRMPLSPDLSPGHPLSPEEIATLTLVLR